MLSLCSFAYECEFKLNDKTINYDADELKFYEITDTGKILLEENEVQELFPDYQIIKISQFDKNRKFYIKNSLFKSKKVLVLNNRNRTFHDFFVYPESSRAEFKAVKEGKIKSLIVIYGKKNVRIKHSGGDEFEIVVK